MSTDTIDTKTLRKQAWMASMCGNQITLGLSDLSLLLDAADRLAALEAEAASWRRVAERLEEKKQAAQAELAEILRITGYVAATPLSAERQRIEDFNEHAQRGQEGQS